MKVTRFFAPALLLTLAFSLLLPLSFTVSSPVSVKAADPFDPNALIADLVFTAKDTMSVDDIQAFLVTKNSVLARVPTTDLGIGANGRSAAQIIWDAARASITDYGPTAVNRLGQSVAGRPSNPFTVSLNPQVILSTLQKEQSLITGTYVVGSATTNNALKSAMGMGCPDGGGCDATYSGFANQVTMGAATLWLNYWRMANDRSAAISVPRWVGSTFNFQTMLPNVCGSDSRFSNVTIGNAATSSLYVYTTGCNGNYNFWYLMNLWFAPVAFRPEALVRDPSTGIVYLIRNSVRYALTGASFAAWGFDYTQITVATGAQLLMPTATNWTQLAQADDGTVYKIENGKKRVITSGRIFEKSGFSWSDVAPIPTAVLAAVPTGLPVHELVLPEGDGTIYIASLGVLYPMTADAYKAWAFRSYEVGRVPAYSVTGLESGPVLSRFVLPLGGDGTIFFVDRGYGYGISAAAAKNWGFDLSTTRRLNGSMTDEIGNGGLLTNLIRSDDGNGTIYLMENSVKRPISAAGWKRNKYSSANVRIISADFLARYPTGAVVK